MGQFGSDSPGSCRRFHLAAMRGNVDCLEAMLAHGVDAMTKDSSGEGAAATHPWLTPGPPQGPLLLLPLLRGAGGTEVTATRSANCPSFLRGLER